MALCALFLSLLVPGIEYSAGMEGILDRLALALPEEQIVRMRSSIDELPLHPFWLALIQGLAAGITVNGAFAFGEELGWRGFLQREVEKLGFYRSSLFVGVIWGAWHAPVILQGHNYPQHPVAGVFLMVLWCTLLAPLFTYIRARSGSVIAAAVFHGSINGTVGISFMLIRGGNDLTSGMLGLPGIAVLLAANAGLYLYDKTAERQPLIGGAGNPDRGS
jgi:membrane protease YdiL (CAAX protease family)